ncbi:hypothetical protein A9404_00605 [Halothiobacillus diazotrophicus]|uniref:DUF1840 domain-containing protein n=1 Tax=Halothiobacillus diazotrophicus TaxID=1860122 RepID=A0A191ZDY8_9GAMM|nr:DUF1840 domain-containing protein [Halothiobacillus diazotrophicus]ANJ66079.1 hypothetical protein A9404_00605 [Halothiobacillus diazotrophicus]
MITFHTQASANISMFQADALRMLRMMGVGDSVPGAIRAADVPDALRRLQASVTEAQRNFVPAQDAADDEEVAPETRAQPLIRLLNDAASAGKDVLWSDASLFD